MPTPENDSPESRFYLQLEAWMEADERERLISIRDKIDDFLDDADEEEDGEEEGADDLPELPHATHLENFKRCHPQPPKQPAIGRSHQVFLDILNRICGTHLTWPVGYPSGLLNRCQVRELCMDHDIHPLVVYAAIMAWGSQRPKHFKSTLQEPSRAHLISLIKNLRIFAGDRIAGFAFAKQAAARIKGLGLSYFTKLLFFLRPSADAYILDQFTAKSALLLFPACPARLHHDGHMPSPETTPEAYGAYCLAVEKLGYEMGTQKPWKGDVVESAMFDERGGVWRGYVRGQFPRGGRKLRKSSTPPPLPPDARPALRLAHLIAGEHMRALESGQQLPPTYPRPIDIPRVIARCGGNGGTCWQYIIKKASLIAMVEIKNRLMERRDRIQAHLSTSDPDDLLSIKQTGNSDGKTITYEINLPINWGEDEADWPLRSSEIVKAMSTLHRNIAALL